MLRILAAALFALLFSLPAAAQQAITVDSCSSVPTLDVGGAHVVYMDKKGAQCTSTLSWNGTGWDPMSGLLVGTAGAPAADVVTVQGPNAGGAFPTAATPIQGNGVGTTGAVVGTLAGAASKTTYLCDFDISAIGGTAAVGPVTVAGLLGGSKVYQLSSSAAGVTLSKSFSPCIPASAVNTAITITTTANGTATAVDVNSSGYQQ